MSNRRFEMYEYRQIILRLRSGEGLRPITRSTLVDRKTVRKIRDVAQREGWLDSKEVPDNETIEKILGGPKLINELTGEIIKTWIFVMVLGWSRHMYAEIILKQDVETWLGYHRRAFCFFNGIPEKIIIDNAKCAITKAAITIQLFKEHMRNMQKDMVLLFLLVHRASQRKKVGWNLE